MWRWTFICTIIINNNSVEHLWSTHLWLPAVKAAFLSAPPSACAVHQTFLQQKKKHSRKIIPLQALLPYIGFSHRLGQSVDKLPVDPRGHTLQLATTSLWMTMPQKRTTSAVHRTLPRPALRWIIPHNVSTNYSCDLQLRRSVHTITKPAAAHRLENPANTHTARRMCASEGTWKAYSYMHGEKSAGMMSPQTGSRCIRCTTCTTNSAGNALRLARVHHNDPLSVPVYLSVWWGLIDWE